MDAISNLVNQVTSELEKINNMSDIVGNRPHFPMFVASNVSSEQVYTQLRKKIVATWPQSASKLVFTAYSSDKNGALQLKSAVDGAAVEEEKMRGLLDEIRYSQESFAGMGMWCVYNIIDTSTIETLDEFKELYTAINPLKGIVVDGTRTMLIVVLDDSSSKREIAKEIKYYLSEGIDGYDGAFIVSNRTQNNALRRSEDVYRIVSNILVLSNNDAVANYDNDAYTARVSCFYNRKINTVSYSILEKPNKKIALQLIDTIVRYAKDKWQVFGNEELDQHEWRKKLGIGNRIDICEEYLKKVQVDFDTKLLQYLPMKRGEDIEKLDVSRVTFSQFSQLTFKGVLEQFIENYYKTELMNDANIMLCIDAFESRLKENVTAPTFTTLNNDIVESIFGQLEEGAVSTSLSVSAYIKEQMLTTIRKSIIYPKCKETILALKNSADKSIKEFSTVQADLLQAIPLGGFDDLGDMYKIIVENYLNSPNGEKDISVLLAPGNTYDDILKYILQIVENIISNNKKDFSLPFVNWFRQRLNLVGDAIYREIYRTLDEDSRSKIHLFGNFAVEEKLQIYMLHTTDARGELSTELYNHLHQAYKDVFGAQFFNTGSDDSLEVMKIIDCTGEKLKL